MATTSDLRTGLMIRWNGQLHRVTEFHHHAPGNWRAMVIMKLKNVQTGKSIEERVRAGSDIEIVRVDKRTMQYLYRDGDRMHFMDTESFEQLEIPEDTVGDGAQFLKENEMADVLFYDETKILGVELPPHVTRDRGGGPGAGVRQPGRLRQGRYAHRRVPGAYEVATPVRPHHPFRLRDSRQ
jgi:elongation factor P